MTRCQPPLEQAEPQPVAPDADGDPGDLRDPEADHDVVAESVGRPRVDGRPLPARLHERRLVRVAVEPRPRRLPERLARPAADLSEQLDDVAVVVERRLAGQRVARPVAGVEPRHHRPRGVRDPVRELGGLVVAGRLRVLAQGDDRLQLRVQHDEVAEAVEADPRPGRERLHEPPRDGRERAAARGDDLGPRERGACAGERLCADGLRHPGRPGRRPSAVREVVLPHGAAPARDGPGDERGRELGGLRPASRRGLDVEPAHVRERMELQPVAPAGAIDDAVRGRDVGAGRRERAALEVARVHVQHGEEGERTRRVEHRRLEPDEVKDVRERDAPGRGKHGERGARPAEDLAVPRRLRAREALRLDGPGQPALDRQRVIRRPGMQHGRRRGMQKQRLRGRSSVSQGCGEKHS